MRSVGNVLVACGVACAVACLPATTSAASDSESASRAEAADADGGAPASHRRWVVSLGLLGGATVQRHHSTATSSCQNGGPGDPDDGIAACDFLVSPGPADLRRPSAGTDYAVSPWVGTSLEVMSPTLPRLPGRPRIFLSGDLTLTFGSTRNIAIEGEPERVRLPDTVVALQDTNSLLLNGVGSRTTSEIETLGWGAAVGVAVPFRFRGRQLWLKPSFAWTRFGVEVEGAVVAGLKDDPVPGPGNSPPWGAQLREIILTNHTRHTFHGIGPGLELALEAGRFGPIGATVFGSFNTYRILGNRRVVLTDSASFAALPPAGPPGNANGLPADDYAARWSFSTSPWLFRGAVGVRFQWLGR